MQSGFQVDSLGRQAFRQTSWVAGPAQARDETFLGMKMFEEWAVKVQEEDLYPIVSLRCSECGYLESYAPSPGSSSKACSNDS